MKPFNLERALAGDPVVTRAGEPVGQLHKFDTIEDDCVFGVVEGEVYSWKINGNFLERDEDSKDLFMATKKHQGWINIYPDKYAYTTGGDIHNSEKSALLTANNHCVVTIKIEWEE